jgi:hypothetical protein
MNEKTDATVYSLSEKEYINYTNKIYLDKQAINELLFDEPSLSGDDKIQALLCEQYASCHNMSELLEETKDTFNSTDQLFYLNETQALRFIFLLSSLAQVKEELLKISVSLSFH